MTGPIRFSLLPEGTSDGALLPILGRTLAAHVAPTQLLDPKGELVDESRLRHGLRDDRGAWIREAIRAYPCEVLFVHRDADAAGPAARLGEIAGWEAAAAVDPAATAVVPVVPVRMTEAWLLVDEPAIREAANNPRGRAPLRLPPPRSIERQRDPKAILFAALRVASELRPGRQKHFNTYVARHRVSRFMTDLTRLRQLSAFNAFEQRVQAVCAARGWT